nr:MAG TPA: hypothetical protein [Caudoviricetes sp.]
MDTLAPSRDSESPTNTYPARVATGGLLIPPPASAGRCERTRTHR